MIRENIDLSFPSHLLLPWTSTQDAAFLSIWAVVLHVCVFHTLSLAVLVLIFGHSVCGCEKVVVEGETWARDEQFWLMSIVP